MVTPTTATTATAALTVVLVVFLICRFTDRCCVIFCVEIIIDWNIRIVQIFFVIDWLDRPMRDRARGWTCFVNSKLLMTNAFIRIDADGCAEATFEIRTLLTFVIKHV